MVAVAGRVPAEAENLALLEIPRKTLVDRVLSRLPVRERSLADPPAGSGLLPVRGDAGLPYLGRSVQYLRWGPAELLNRYRKYGPVSFNSALGASRVMVAGPAAVDEILGRRRQDYGQGWDWFIGPFFHRGLLLLEFDEHMFHRRIMQQAFTRERLQEHLGELTGVVDQAIDGWAAAGERPVRLYPTIKELTLRIATDVFMAVDSGADRERLGKAFLQCTHAALAILRFSIPGGNWRAGLRGRKVLEEYFTRMIAAKRRAPGPDFFSALCRARTEDGAVFSDADVVNHMIFLIMAAHDTTTTTATTTAYYLGRHPQWQRRVRAEALALHAELDGAPPTIADLDRLTDLDLVIRESLRLVPPVPGLVRRAVRDTQVAGHFVPAGTQVDVAYGVNHMLPELWSRPELFDPERFAEPRREDRSHRLAWLPFGAGAHKCIGMHFGTFEVKTVLAAMLRDYDWRVPDDYLLPWGYSTIPFPRDGAPVLLRRR
ncbi:cytochrome P450 [Nocardia uniformis]|uniref:Cytochrome P450 n=1 Tax=Nocardia uniformis TaxID=53432 RepID=A0A849BS82_9NOCA|nr:cytochrome P450 [Nocardia uniformis]NNH69453.1 cytochrome P450 [Nocardia uniformis]